MKLSPTGRYGDMFDENPKDTYGFLLKELSLRGVGSVEIMRPTLDKDPYGLPNPLEQFPDLLKFVR